MKNQVILISGGSRGLGAALATAFHAEGATVVTFSRTETPFIRHMKDDPRFYWQMLDILDSAGCKAMIQNLIREFGQIDVLINNVGAALDQLLPLTSESEITSTLNLNLEAAIRTSRLVVRGMLPRGQGCILNISSVLGHRGFKGTTVYAAAKAGLDGFSRALARELGPRGIRVNSISPGFIATEMTDHLPEGQRQQILRRTPLGRLGQPEDVAGLALFLASEQASFITGQSIIVDGGLIC